MMPSDSRNRDRAVVALAGRRIDAFDTDPPRFPPEAVPTVRRRLTDLFVRENAIALVCSAACGADLIALDVAERLGLRKRIILPVPADQFRETSVVDRGAEEWGPVFDRLVDAAENTEDLIVLPPNDGSDEAMYAAANAAIVQYAQELAKKGNPHRLVAAVVWEGFARPGSDATAHFRDLAVTAGFEERVVITRSVVWEAKNYIRGAALTPEQAEDLVERLKSEDRFGWARRVLTRVRATSIPDVALRTRLAQQHAHCTYKDPDVPVLQALDEALAILHGSLDLRNTSDQETLGLAGAIHKRRWRVTGHKDQLERSYHYYRRGYNVGIEKDLGYTSINAAFVLDELADIEAAAGTPWVKARRAEAKEIREAVVAQLLPLRTANPQLETEWWYLVTVADALFGLHRYDEAERWLLDAKAIPDVADWKFRSTASQLATLHQLQHRGSDAPDDPLAARAAKVLDSFLDSRAAREDAFIGKVGLALSGGGFRASLYHIGVLAKLAELDVLRRVEVLSCVSGGSIIGTQYYLQLREALETTDLESLSEEKLREFYLEVMRRVASDFLAGVQRNIRTRVFANPFPLLRLFVDRGYTRTVRLGELLESQLFARVWLKSTERRPDGPLLLKHLKIRPKDARQSFNPKIHNWRRKAKVPILVLNATTLNTGHAWQYTASYMGESPWAIDPHADGTPRLRRMYHDEAPPKHRRTRLAQAVAASACVPGLFEPIRLDGLYELEERGRKADSLVVRHVDGGVHDNQGIASLLEQGCGVVLVSDASGQTGLAVDPGGGTAAPLLRSNSVLMQRVRQEQYARLGAMRQGGILKGAMFIHLKKDLDVVPVGWVGSEEPPESLTQEDETLTEYGIRKEVQRLLAGIRTDLDSFSQIEAFALMTSGYRMTEFYLPKVEVLPIKKGEPVLWDFLEIEDVLRDASTSDSRYKRIVHLLKTGDSRMFRIWSQSRIVRVGTVLLVLIGGALILPGFLNLVNPSDTSLTLNGGVLLTAIALAISLASAVVREQASRFSMGLLSLALWIPAQIHLRLVDRLFLWMGRLDRLR